SGVTATTGSGAGTAEFDVSISRVDPTTVSTTWRNVSARLELLSLRATVVASEAAAEERRHIARDLHDGLLQQVLASGMLASSLLPLLGAEAAEVGERIVVLHDAQVRQLRTMMLDLADGATAPRGLVGEVRSIVAEAGAALGFEPSLSVLGDLDTVGEIVGEHLAYSLREILSNAARHAHATRVDVSLHLFANRLTLTVADDGGGFEHSNPAGRGLLNLAGRARQLGGSFGIAPGDLEGTVATWHVPLTRPARDNDTY
ncbi:MAG: sensor histidine kinase, partial [Ilumatobacteraceae bacterium]